MGRMIRVFLFVAAVAWRAGAEAFPPGSPWEMAAIGGAELFLAAFWDRLRADSDPYGLYSEWLCKEPVVGGVRHFVLQYRDFGFPGSGNPQDQRVSFQIHVAENDPFAVHVSFLSATPSSPGGGGDDLRRFGALATLGLQTRRVVLRHSYHEPVAQPGIRLVYHFGTGTDPLSADTDAATNSLRMWINDDRDNGSIADGDSDVPTGGTGSFWDFSGANFKDRTVNGMSDLEDFFPVWLDVSNAVAAVRECMPTARLAIRIRGADADVVVVRITPYGTNDAANASAAQLRIDPVFNHDPPKILSGNLQRQDVDELLARGVPALSGPVGSMELENYARNRQTDLNDIADVVGWPHVDDDDWQGWHHSDIKNIAMPFVHDVFETILGTVQP